MKSAPDKNGFFGKYGGMYVPDTLIPALNQLEQAYADVKNDKEFFSQLSDYLNHYVGRPSPLYYAKNISQDTGLTIYLKREDLIHTGAHKINNTMGQILLAKRMGKTRIIAETGAGQHGVATATASALLDMECEIFMGAVDIKRQALNVERMKLMGATVTAVTAGAQTLKEATSQAIREWMKTVDNTHYIIGSALGPHPYPYIVREFQSVIGREAKQQFYELQQKLPAAIVACIGGGSNAMGIFHDFVEHSEVRLIGVEAAGKGLETIEHAASLSKGTPGILHGSLNRLIQTKDGQIDLAHSISAGLDYPGVGPELCFLRDEGRLETLAIADDKAIEGCHYLAKKEGIIPALETAHAIALLKEKNIFKPGDNIIVCLSGRGDKDMETIANYGK